MKIEDYGYTGEGLKRVYENSEWTVGIKNWKPGSDPMGIDCLERHNETDELFVLIEGKCSLVFANETDGGLVIESVEMVPDRVYNIPQGLWHNAATTKDAKLILIENSSTGMANSDILTLTPEQIETVRKLVC